MENSINTLENHIVILGWSSRVKRIIDQLRNDGNFSSDSFEPILVVAPNSDITQLSGLNRVYFILGDITDLHTLKRANIQHAKVVLIPSEIEEVTTSDGNGVFALLATLSLNPDVRICVEVASAAHGLALEQIREKKLLARSVEVVSFESLAERLLAQSAINAGITKVYDHLLSFDESNEVYPIELPAIWSGRTFRDLALSCFEKQVLLIGYESDGKLVINPRDRNYVFSPGDRAWFISYDLDAVSQAVVCKGD